MIATPPTSEEQVIFLRNVQRLLSEGQFTASYKLALLHAIADLCVIKGDDSGGELSLATGELAEKFIELYWQQCRPFQLGGEKAGFTLLQNKGSQAAIIRKIINAQSQYGSLFRLRQSAPDLWKSLINEVKRTITEMPLWKLQTIGSDRLDFLYDNLARPVSAITLKPGVAYCFRAFYGLMRDLIQGAWIRFVQKVNCVNHGILTHKIIQWTLQQTGAFFASISPRPTIRSGSSTHELARRTSSQHHCDPQHLAQRRDQTPVP